MAKEISRTLALRTWAWEVLSRPKIERGSSRLEHYNGAGRQTEPFGLNKRARRLSKGIPVSLPDGTWPKEAQ